MRAAARRDQAMTAWGRGRVFNIVERVNRLETKTRGDKQSRMADDRTRLETAQGGQNCVPIEGQFARRLTVRRMGWAHWASV